MKNISSKLKIGAQNVNIMAYNNERLILNVFFWVFGVLAFLYVCLVGNMIKNIVERKSLETNMNILANEVNILELSYLSISNSVDLDLSHSLGFKETKTIYATRKSLGFGNIKLAQNEI